MLLQQADFEEYGFCCTWGFFVGDSELSRMDEDMAFGDVKDDSKQNSTYSSSDHLFRCFAMGLNNVAGIHE